MSTPPTPPEARRITAMPIYIIRGFDEYGRLFVSMPIHAATAGIEAVRANAFGMLKDAGHICASFEVVAPTPPTQSPAPEHCDPRIGRLTREEAEKLAQFAKSIGAADSMPFWMAKEIMDKTAPALLAGGTAHDPSTAPAEVAAGCKEGRPVEPATGEREAELREAAQNFATDLYAEHTTISFVRLRETFILAVAPLLDRREGELSQHWRLSSVCREKEAELAALRTLVAKKDEALPSITLEQLHESVTEVICGRDFSFELAKNGTIAGLRAQLTSAQTALRASEAARGEDSKLLDWLEKNAIDFEFRFMLNGSVTKNFASGVVIRAVIAAARDAARAQEEKP